MKNQLPKVETSPNRLERYEEFLPPELAGDLERLRSKLQGVKVVHLNATPYGGGVAEILKSLIPLMQSAGIAADWYAMPAHEAFFAVTKSFHNALQGADYELTAEDQAVYLKHNQRTARLLAKVPADIYVIHDPQPAAIIEFADLPRTVWRCHIDTSTPNQAVWDFLSPYISRHDELIFTLPEFVHPGTQHEQINYFAPTIDPLAVKNIRLEPESARAILRPFGIDVNRPLVTQVSRFDPWKDPQGVIDAFRLARAQVPGLQLALVGSMALDDPEGQATFRAIKAYAGHDKDIFLLTNLTGVGEVEVNAFQTQAEVVIQKSVREGFGLTVAEAMWKQRAVIGGKVGGIKIQIQNGRTGYLVDSVEECAERMVQLLRDPALRRVMGLRGQEHVRNHFLHPRLLRDHLQLYLKMLART
jgi:trehalose synthase